MRRWIALSIMVFCAANAEIIDRIAVSVGSQIITTDQINDEIRIEAFLNHAAPNLTPDEKKKTAERLIEQALIKREMEFTHYPSPPMSEAEQEIKKIAAEYADHQALVSALERYDITEDDLRRHMWWQITLLKFTDERFRPTVQVSTAEIRQYYRQQVAKWREQGAQNIPTFEESRDAMEKALTEERVNQVLDRWLGDARTQIDIRFRNGVFQ